MSPGTEAARASPDRHDLIVLDAFSSDAIPVHLLTREAIAGYMSRLTSHGVILAHISNRHLDLTPMLANVAQALDLTAFAKQDYSNILGAMLRTKFGS